MEGNEFSESSSASHTSSTLQRSQSSNSERILLGLSTYPFHSDREFQSGLAAILGHPETPASQEEIDHNAELVLQAKCFYFTRHYSLETPVDPVAYTSWLQSRNSNSVQSGNASAVLPIQVSGQSAGISATRTPKARTPEASAPSNGILQTPANQFAHATPPPISQTTAISPSPIGSAQPQAVQTNLSQDEPPYPTSFAHIVDLITRNQPVPGIETIPDTVLEASLSPPNTTPARRKPWEKTAAAEDDTTAAAATTDPEHGGPSSARKMPGGNEYAYGGLFGAFQRGDFGAEPNSGLGGVGQEAGNAQREETAAGDWQKNIEQDTSALHES